MPRSGSGCACGRARKSTAATEGTGESELPRSCLSGKSDGWDLLQMFSATYIWVEWKHDRDIAKGPGLAGRVCADSLRGRRLPMGRLQECVCVERCDKSDASAASQKPGNLFPLRAGCSLCVKDCLLKQQEQLVCRE